MVYNHVNRYGRHFQTHLGSWWVCILVVMDSIDDILCSMAGGYDRLRSNICCFIIEHGRVVVVIDCQWWLDSAAHALLDRFILPHEFLPHEDRSQSVLIPHGSLPEYMRRCVNFKVHAPSSSRTECCWRPHIPRCGLLPVRNQGRGGVRRQFGRYLSVRYMSVIQLSVPSVRPGKARFGFWRHCRQTYSSWKRKWVRQSRQRPSRVSLRPFRRCLPRRGSQAVTGHTPDRGRAIVHNTTMVWQTWASMGTWVCIMYHRTGHD